MLGRVVAVNEDRHRRAECAIVLYRAVVADEFVVLQTEHGNLYTSLRSRTADSGVLGFYYLRVGKDRHIKLHCLLRRTLEHQVWFYFSSHKRIFLEAQSICYNFITCQGKDRTTLFLKPSPMVGGARYSI